MSGKLDFEPQVATGGMTDVTHWQRIRPELSAALRVLVASDFPDMQPDPHGCFGLTVIRTADLEALIAAHKGVYIPPMGPCVKLRVAAAERPVLPSWRALFWQRVVETAKIVWPILLGMAFAGGLTWLG